jgi:chromosome segregation ATPase
MPPPPPQQPNYVLPAQDGGGGSGVKMAILFGAVVALIAANVYLFLQIDGLKQELAKNRETLLAEVGRVKETSSVTTAAAQRNMETLKDELETARRQASMAVGQAKVDAEKHANEVAARLAQQQRASEAQLKGQISQVEQSATAANTKIGEVSTEVGTVKTDLSNTKSELDKTISSLKSVSGDLGVQSGLIATNSKELAALIALGQRNYFEFNLGKTKQPQRVGDIMVQLKKADQKKNRYTVEITADDKRVEKKDKGVNEPVQFYTSKARQPYEMVVNEVKKDVIVGYLSTPKVQTGR